MIVLAFLIQILSVVSLAFDEISKYDANTVCSNPPPGVSKMIRGVDITTLDMTPVDITAETGFKYPVLGFTCNKKKVWKNPQNKEYQLPDQVWLMTTVPRGTASAKVELYKTEKDVRSSFGVTAGGGGGDIISKLFFSGSQSLIEYQHIIHNTSKFVGVATGFESTTSVDMIPESSLGIDQNALEYIDTKVSGTFESNRQDYNGFIKEFGTHYFAKGNFGGYIRMTFETNKDYVYSEGETKTKTNAEISFLKIISLFGGVSVESKSISEFFNQSTVIKTRYYGGDTNLLKSDGRSKWQPTVDEDPWLFSGELKPIYLLIPNVTKRESMKKAVNEYVMRSYLEELTRTLAALRMKLSKDDVLIALQSRLDEMKSLGTLKEADVDTLADDITDQTVIPTWFTDKTKLCFKWKPDGDSRQCGGGTDNLLCAATNKMTSGYNDYTDYRSGGCLMQWLITSSGYPSWFEDVQICFRWDDEGDIGQCGGGAPRTICSSINNYAREYRDDTDERKGGCKMSWKILVPSSAPAWMKMVKLCYRWNPLGYEEQCSASSRKLCAMANTWTDYYRDDTRSSGCRMRWGLTVGAKFDEIDKSYLIRPASAGNSTAGFVNPLYFWFIITMTYYIFMQLG